MKKTNDGVKRRPFREAVGKRLEVDADMFLGGSLVEIKGRCRVEVMGVKKVGSYTTECVTLVLHQGAVSIVGERLECIFYRCGEAAVEGRISSVCFLDKEGI